MPFDARSTPQLRQATVAYLKTRPPRMTTKRQHSWPQQRQSSNGSIVGHCWNRTNGLRNEADRHKNRIMRAMTYH
eukprot:4058344-Lingulodinium_polyedra.AAC.1